MPLLRFALLLAALAVAGFLVAAHGVRALAVLMALAVLATVTRSRYWRVAERVLVRYLGSRRRAAVAVMLVVIVIALAYNLYPLIHTG